MRLAARWIFKFPESLGPSASIGCHRSQYQALPAHRFGRSVLCCPMVSDGSGTILTQLFAALATSAASLGLTLHTSQDKLRRRPLHITVELIDRLPHDVAASLVICRSARDGHRAEREVVQNRLESQSSIADWDPPLEEFQNHRRIEVSAARVFEYCVRPPRVAPPASPMSRLVPCQSLTGLERPRRASSSR
jgi:hypothetical protein